MVVNLASALLPGSSSDDFYNEIRDDMFPMMKLIDMMRDAGVGRIVFLSSGGAIYGKNEHNESRETDVTEPMNYYGWMKGSLEEYIRIQSRIWPLRYLILRPSNPYGMFQNLYGKQGLVSVIFGKILKRQSLEIWGDGSVIRDYIHIADFCNTLTSLLLKGARNETLNVGSGAGSSVNDIIHLAQEISGQSLKVNYREARPVDSKYAVLDISMLRRIIDFHPVSLRQGMTFYWDIIRSDSPHEQ